MRLKIKNNWTIFATLLLVNVALVSSILLAQSKSKKNTSCNSSECMQSKKSFNADALNSITIKLM